MKILAIESAARAASVALTEDDRPIAERFLHTELTHSRTLLPMVEGVLADCGVTVGEVGLIAVAAGPGSFTGVRIGVAAAKGLAFAAGLPCAGVSTLEAMAWRLAHMGGEICAVMDARRGEVYNARFAAEGGGLRRLTPDRAIALSDLAREVGASPAPQILVGDGAGLCYNAFSEAGLAPTLAPPHLLLPSAWGVARGGLALYRAGETTDAAGLVARYCRKSQAEREYEERR